MNYWFSDKMKNFEINMWKELNCWFIELKERRVGMYYLFVNFVKGIEDGV